MTNGGLRLRLLVVALASCPNAWASDGSESDSSTVDENNTVVPDDIGLCLGVADDDKAVGRHCRDFDRDQKTCDNQIEGCFWIPLPRCGQGPCIDLYTDDKETTNLFMGTLVTACFLLVCCFAGWVTVACCCCLTSRRRKRDRLARKERIQVQLELEARNADVFAEDDEERVDGLFNHNASSVHFDEDLAVKDPEAGDGAGTDDVETTTTSSDDTANSHSSLPTGSPSTGGTPTSTESAPLAPVSGSRIVSVHIF